MLIITPRRRSIVVPPPGARLNSGHPLSQGLIAAYLCNEGAGYVLKDLVGVNDANHIATNISTAPTQWKENRYATNISSDMNQAAQPRSNTVINAANQGFTVAAWATPIRSLTAFNRVVETNFASAFAIMLASGTDAWEWDVNNWGLGTCKTGAGTAVAGRESFIVGNYDGGSGTPTGRIFLDGVQIATKTVAAPNINTVMYIGRDTSAAAFWRGFLGPIYVWNRALSPTEIAGLYIDRYAVVTTQSPRLSLYFSSLPPIDQAHNLDSVIADLLSKAHNLDADVQVDADKSHTLDAVIDTSQIISQAHTLDAYLAIDRDKAHTLDSYVKDLINRSHTLDAFLLTNDVSPAHYLDAFVAGLGSSYVLSDTEIIFPIDPANLVDSDATVLEMHEELIQGAATLLAGDDSFLLSQTSLRVDTRSYVKSNASVQLANRDVSHSLDAAIADYNRAFIQSSATLVQTVSAGYISGVFPDNCFVRSTVWLVISGGSKQIPGSNVEDFDSSATAANLYNPSSSFRLDGINLIITGFTTGVVSYQTRTRQWLQRVDVAPGGYLVSTEVQTRTLATGEVITRTTETTQEGDTTTVKVTTQNSATPTLTNVRVSQKTRTGSEVTREISIQNVNGVKQTSEKKIVTTTPPLTDNIQPIKVTTLDGISHFQWFGVINPEFAGGDQEGTTASQHTERIVPGTLPDGSTTNSFGNPIYALVADDLVTKPSGETVATHSETVGTITAGTTTTDTASEFNGVSKKTTTTVKSPDGGTTVTERTEDLLTGDSLETSTTVDTDEFGQVTTTIQTTETVTTLVNGVSQTQVTTTTRVTKGEVTTEETTVTVPDFFEDSLVSQKVKVFMIKEFTISCVIDETNYQALLAKHFSHQTQYALIELFGQQLGNAHISYNLRQSLEGQFNRALDELKPLSFIALGKVYNVVFAPSASAFRGKYIIGAEPHIYELQIIVQERTDLILGANGTYLTGSSGESNA